MALARTVNLGIIAVAVCGWPAASMAVGEFDVAGMVHADRLINEAIGRGDSPGAVLLVGQAERIVYRRAYGYRAVQPDKVKMTVDTIFDLASLTKPVACATSIVMLIERGQLSPADKVSRYIPQFGSNGKQDITVEQLLLHRGGLVADNPLADYADGPAKALANVYALEAKWEPGTRFVYSDVGHIVLGELVRIVDGRRLDQFAREEIFEPLGMKHTGFRPPDEWKSRCAPTGRRQDRWLIGEVHDPRAWALGGVAGHAGLFATADDLTRWCRMILAGGTGNRRRILSETSVRQMTRPRCLPDGTGCRSWGFDVDTPYSSARGDLFEPGTTFGHTGYTGTSFWIDPAHEGYLILLTNRLHPDGKGSVVELRRQVATVTAAAMMGKPYPPPANVRCGIDVLKGDHFKPLAGSRVGIITNHTGRDREGNRTIDLLVEAPDVKVVRLFSPEHGLYGTVDEEVAHATDNKTALPVSSLYGETRRPTAKMLEGVDTLVFDIQDVGTRFYTYIATMGYAMEEAARHRIRMVVLDRPNPITGTKVAGPIADRDRLGFTAYGPLPVVHGMTVGELARMFNVVYGIGCELVVVEMAGWRRSMWWDETGLTWINPSPNMRNLTQATLYPAIGLLEATNLSVGRGTDQPFEILGAPWIDGRKLAAALNGAKLPGLRFVPITFTPKSSKFAGKPCHGVYVMTVDRDAVEPVRSGLTIAWHLKKLFGDAFQIDRVIHLLANEETMAALKTTEDPNALPGVWETQLEAFKQVRRRYLLYQ